MLEDEYNLLFKRSIKKLETNITQFVENNISSFLKDAEAFINHKIDQAAEKFVTCWLCVNLKMRLRRERKNYY